MLVRETGGNEAVGGDAVRYETTGFNRRFGGGGGISCTLSSVSVSYHLDRLRDAGEVIAVRSLKARLAMSSGPSNVLFDDLFTINDIDREGKKFDRGKIQLTSVCSYSRETLSVSIVRAIF